METDTTSFSIDGVTGYKYEYAEPNGGEIDRDNGSVVSVATEESVSGNKDQGEISSYDGPSEGYGYYLLGNSTFNSDVSVFTGNASKSSAPEMSYAGALKLQDYTLNDNNKARVTNFHLSAGAEFKVRWHRYNNSTSSFEDSWCEPLTPNGNQNSPTHYSITNNIVHINIDGTYSFYLQQIGNSYLTWIEGDGDNGTHYRIAEEIELNGSIDSKKHLISKPKMAGTLGDYTIYFSRPVTMDSSTVTATPRVYYWGSGISGPSWAGTNMTSAFTNWSNESVYLFSLPAGAEGAIINFNHIGTDGDKLYKTTDINGNNLPTANGKGYYISTFYGLDGIDKKYNFGVWSLRNVTFAYNANGGSGSINGSPFTFRADEKNAHQIRDNSFTRDGYCFAGWNTNPNGTGTSFSPGDYVPQSFLKDLADGSTTTLYAQWSECFDGGQYVYFKPNATWNVDNPRYAVYLCNGPSADTWIPKMSKIGDGYYAAQLPAGGKWKNLIFTRMNPGNESTDWDYNSGYWGYKTADLTPSQYNCYVISSGGNLPSGDWQDCNASFFGNANSATTYYLKVNSSWKTDSTRYAAFLCNGTSSARWIEGSQIGSSDYYSFNLPAGKWFTLIFVHMKASGELDWENKLDYQTSDLTPDASFRLWDVEANGWASHTRTVTVTGTSHGSVSATNTTVDLGGSSVITATPDSGYHFLNWNGSVSDNPKTLTNITENVTYTAYWEGNSYTITLSAPDADNDDYSEHPSSDAIYGSSLPSIATLPTREGYAFNGYWTTASREGVQYYDSAGDPVPDAWDKTQDTTLHARWAIWSITIEYDANGGTGSGPASSFIGSKPLGTIDLASASVYEKVGYRITGWSAYVGDGSVGDPFAVLTPGGSHKFTASEVKSDGATITLKAIWTANTYTIVFAAGTGGSGSMSNMNMTYGSSKALTANAFTRTGYHFDGWSGSNDRSYTDGQTVSNLTAVHEGTVTLTAQWAANTYTVSFNGNGTNSVVATATVDHTYDNPAIDITVSPYLATRNGYTFAGWYTEADGGVVVTSISSTINADTTYYAHWSAKSCTVTFNLNGALDASVDPASRTVYFDSTLGNVIVTRTGYKVSSWNTNPDGSGTGYTSESTIDFYENKTLFAQWIAVTDIYIVKTFDYYVFNTIWIYWWTSNDNGDIKADYLNITSDGSYYYKVSNIPSEYEGFIICGGDDEQKWTRDPSDQTGNISPLSGTNNTVWLNEACDVNNNRTHSEGRMIVIEKSQSTFTAAASGYVITGNDHFINPAWSYSSQNLMSTEGLIDPEHNKAEKLGVYLAKDSQIIIYPYLTSVDSPVALIIDPSNPLKVLGDTYSYANTNYSQENPDRNIQITSSGSYSIYLNNSDQIFIYRLELYVYVYDGSSWSDPYEMSFGDNNPYYALYEKGITLSAGNSLFVSEIAPKSKAIYGYPSLIATPFATEATDVNNRTVGGNPPTNITEPASTNAIRITKNGLYTISLKIVNDTRKVEILDAPSKGDGYYITYSDGSYGLATGTKMYSITSESAFNKASYFGFFAAAGMTIKIRSFLGYNHMTFTSIGNEGGYTISDGVIRIAAKNIYNIFITDDDAVHIVATSFDRFFRLNSVDTTSMSDAASVQSQNTSLVLEVRFKATSSKNMSLSVSLPLVQGGTNMSSYVNVYLGSISTVPLSNPYTEMRSAYYADISAANNLSTAGQTFTQGQQYYVYILLDYKPSTSPIANGENPWANLELSLNQA